MSICRRLLPLLTVTSYLLAGTPHWVFFEDDPARPPVKLTVRAEQRLAERGSPMAKGRRGVAPAYIAALNQTGVRIRHISRFLNAVSVEIEHDEQLEYLTQLPFVNLIRPVAQRMITAPVQDQQLARISELSYGPSFTQSEMLHIPAIHDLGYDGSGVLIGVFDTGFIMNHPVFDQLDIQDRYDFVDHEVDPSGVGHEHGINTLSILGGYYPGEVIGPAFGATYLLARTENNNSETRVEEDNWVAALEWADSLGVDIVSSSLNYRDFDGTADDYPPSAIDGETAIITRAANIAAERGILVVNSASNDGPSPGSIWPPADSPQALIVGAINSDGDIMSWSSRGPTYDGRLKPDVVAMGAAVYMASSINSYRTSNGTSFSTPLIAGLAALLIQAHPQLSPDSIIAIFHNHGDRAGSPDNSYGYGLPDLRDFFQRLYNDPSNSSLVYPNPSSGQLVNLVLPNPVAQLVEEANLINIKGQIIASLATTSISEYTLQVNLPTHVFLADQLYLITLQVGNRVYSGKLIYIKS
ncbi:MAG: S8 family peptidase [Candidatus Marinimicrobia bacterium]|nr:S8 family peptidase [Candidatus Neomarinimicrobiota bacterium]